MTDQKNKQHSTNQQHKNENNEKSGNKQAQSKDKGIHKAQKNEEVKDPDEEPVTESDFNPDKKIEVDDDPEGTKRKIPNMKK